MSDNPEVSVMIGKLCDQIERCSPEDLVKAMHDVVITEMSPALRKALLKKMAMALAIKVMKD